ncbi:hypothetical protein BIU82_12840 [Arthrobacter sp. SW1]|uniref:hypothetical protein n=1 Tax=Arthrobacter sp. SW1 TaxID=1920889 RepID=UPI000877BF7B|nr:hypothetical protein [Arthrobacter sp. SW1]OFI36642.1 hypothetical protein BIU82_12840 [Arthrobacter sp. SW1]
MKNARRIVLAVSAAAVLSVTACSAPAPSASPEAQAQPVQLPLQESAAFKKRTEAELTALLKAAKDADGKPFTVMPAAQLKKGVDAAKSMASSTKVTPAECASASASFSGGLQALTGASYAAATSPANKQGVPAQTISLVSGLSEEQLNADLEKNATQAEKCKNVTVEVMGQKVEASVEKLDVASAVPGAIALKTVTKSGAGESTQLLVAAVKGGVALSSLYVSTGDAAEELKKAAATLDTVAAGIK